MFAVSDVCNAVGRMKLGKCPGSDSLHMEAYTVDTVDGGYVHFYAYCLICV